MVVVFLVGAVGACFELTRTDAVEHDNDGVVGICDTTENFGIDVCVRLSVVNVNGLDLVVCVCVNAEADAVVSAVRLVSVVDFFGGSNIVGAGSCLLLHLCLARISLYVLLRFVLCVVLGAVALAFATGQEAFVNA